MKEMFAKEIEKYKRDEEDQRKLQETMEKLEEDFM
jgi:hypothetical protein